MEFTEFFKKKKIDLVALEQGERALFSEFKTHFEQMGEKSFDHTKKYWFNKLRRQFPLAPEVKTEKVHIPNPIAEQTITESLIEAVAAPTAPKLGFAPKFKAANVAKFAENIEDKKEEPEVPKTETSEGVTPAPKAGFVPRFKAVNIAKSAEVAEEKKEEPEAAKVEPAEIVSPAPAPKVGFVPRFKAANIPKTAEVPEQQKKEPEALEAKPVENVTKAPKLGFTPKFRTAPPLKSAENAEDKKAEEEAPKADETESVTAPPAPKLGFTPKFKAATEVPETQKEGIAAENAPTIDNTTISIENTEAKPAYKTRFNMKNIPPKKEE